jgi:hypothetical protein
MKFLAAFLVALSSVAPSFAFAGRPSQDANAANLQASFRKAGAVGSLSNLTSRAWNCYQFSAMEDITASSTFTRTYSSFGNVVVTDAVFAGTKSSGTVQLSNGVVWGGVSGTTDGFVFPYDEVNLYVRRQADGTLIEEWTANPRAMVMSLKHGMALSALYAEQWMDPSVSNPSRVTFVYAVCRPQ